MNNFVKQAYIQGLAARAVLRARIMQKQAGGVKDYAMAGGIGAGGGALIGALVNAARKKNILTGALTGAGVGGVAGLGYQGIKDLMSKKEYGPQPKRGGNPAAPQLPLIVPDTIPEKDKAAYTGLINAMYDPNFVARMSNKYNPTGPLPDYANDVYLPAAPEAVESAL